MSRFVPSPHWRGRSACLRSLSEDFSSFRPQLLEPRLHRQVVVLAGVHALREAVYLPGGYAPAAVPPFGGFIERWGRFIRAEPIQGRLSGARRQLARLEPRGEGLGEYRRGCCCAVTLNGNFMAESSSGEPGLWSGRLSRALRGSPAWREWAASDQEGEELPGELPSACQILFVQSGRVERERRERREKEWGGGEWENGESGMDGERREQVEGKIREKAVSGGSKGKQGERSRGAGRRENGE